MKDIVLTCQDDNRRDDIRISEGFNGLDYLEVTIEEPPKVPSTTIKLSVVLLQKLTPEQMERLSGDERTRHIVLKGGRRTKAEDIAIIDVVPQHSNKKNLDDFVEIFTDKSGDFSDYTLRFVEVEDGKPTDRPMPGFDPRYASITFNFKADCPSDLDCKPKKVCPPEKMTEPDINYLAKDYSSFRQLILDRLSQIMPEWRERHVPDTGIALVEAMAYVGDYLSYYQDAIATEAYLDTARHRISVRRHARLVDYRLHEGNNARTWMHVALEGSDEESFSPHNFYFITGFPDSPVSGKIIFADDLSDEAIRLVEFFEPLVDDPQKEIRFFQSHNEISLYTWGDRDCCLPKGATSATLLDAWEAPQQTTPADQENQAADDVAAPGEKTRKLHLQPGDYLLFEEVKGAKTGKPEDADSDQRHVVRLTNVTQVVDELYDAPDGRPVVEVEWAEADALPFPVCVSAIGPAPDCCLIENISVARGNIVLADHGRSIIGEDLGAVDLQETRVVCLREHRPSDQIEVPAPFKPVLQQPFLTFCDLPQAGAPAAKQLIQDPRAARPHIALTSKKFELLDQVEETWQSVRDLLRSKPDNRHFVVEIDDERKIHLRFGDGELGRLPQPNAIFTADYRVGNGPSGNIGAERIAYIVHRERAIDGIALTPRNPFPAHGGQAPEPISEARLFAPTTFRKKIERAITPEDYQHLTEQHEGVQKAAASFRWTGSWYQILVAVDPFGDVEASEDFLDSIRRRLEPFRRMGHDLIVRLAEFVPLDIVMEICVLPGYTRGHVKAALLDVFSNRVLPDGKLGYFHPDNLTFGQSIRLSQLIAAAQAVSGVESVDVATLERLFEGPNQELENGILPIHPFEIPRLDNDPSFPENGRLTLNVRGEK